MKLEVQQHKSDHYYLQTYHGMRLNHQLWDE